MFEWLRNKIRLGQTFQEFASYVTPDVAPSTPFQNGFDAFMKERDPAYDSYTKLFGKIGPLSAENNRLAFEAQEYLKHLFDQLENVRGEKFTETATTLHDQIKMKGALGSEFKEALDSFLSDLYDEVLVHLFADLHDELESATVEEMQTDDVVHKDAYLFALLWLILSDLYVEDMVEDRKINTAYNDLLKASNVFEAALLLAEQAPRFQTYAKAFYNFHTQTVETLPLSNLNTAKDILVTFLTPYKIKKEDADESKSSGTGEEKKDGTEIKSAESTKERLVETVVHRFVSPNDNNQKPYLVVKMDNTAQVPADYVPVGQPCLGADGEILQAFTNRPKDMFPLLVESTVLLE
jgi:hypothetical protein